MRKSTIAGIVLLLAGALLLAACPKRVSIAELQANPSKYNNKDIAVAGVVRDSYGVNIPGTPIRGGAYKIDDGTGTLWIITEDVVPNKGAEIGVKGRIGSGVSWQGRNFGLGMLEKDRRFRKR
ncbi:MAG TPA: hypothetical protein PKE66_07320 [Pyrinomonadaceae bacterium]|nr:hypothetical protein [Pyrinomonadaceae bacterium]